jgi:hypothetical protein
VAIKKQARPTNGLQRGQQTRTMSSHLYLSFWHLCLENLPQGQFERSVISADDARAMIRDARTAKTLLCVSKDDLLAPYRTKERRRHEELCALLQTSCTLDIRFEDFLTTFDEEGVSIQSVMPLEVVALRPKERLLIVTCNYRLIDKTDQHVDLEERFALTADSLGFHLITALPPQEVTALVTPAGQSHAAA